jgi:hypothetical protein
MDEVIRYAGAMALGGMSAPVALGVAWLALRGIFGAMPGTQRVPARVTMNAGSIAREERGRRAALREERVA